MKVIFDISMISGDGMQDVTTFCEDRKKRKHQIKNYYAKHDIINLRFCSFVHIQQYLNSCIIFTWHSSKKVHSAINTFCNFCIFFISFFHWYMHRWFYSWGVHMQFIIYLKSTLKIESIGIKMMFVFFAFFSQVTIRKF